MYMFYDFLFFIFPISPRWANGCIGSIAGVVAPKVAEATAGAPTTAPLPVASMADGGPPSWATVRGPLALHRFADLLPVLSNSLQPPPPLGLPY